MNEHEKYEKALNTARKMLDDDNLTDAERARIETIFPQLRESPAEKARRGILIFLKNLKQQGAFPKKYDGDYVTWVTWLANYTPRRDENYVLPEFSQWSEDDQRILNRCIDIVELHEIGRLDDYREASTWLKNLKPMPPFKWSKEDDEMLKFYLDYSENKIGEWPQNKVVDMRIKFKKWILNRVKYLQPDLR